MASHGKRAANRPRAMSLEDERSWVDHVRGAALRAWVLRNTLTNSHHRSDVNLAARLFNSNAGYSNSERKAALARFMSKAMDAGAKLAPPARNRKALQKRLLAGHRLYELPKKVRGVSE
ncbi:MAG: hypothetical protein HZC22_19675 [Rhodocyclales bacterium]|nr:hypothetical protein [Rhodocyclales bacterium]